MSSKSKDIVIARLNIDCSYLSHLLNDYILKDQMQTGFYNNDELQIEKHKNDVKWQKQYDKLLMIGEP